MDPLKPLYTPVAEVRHQASHFVDEYGDTWVVIDGIETKVANVAQAKILLAQQDKTRLDIRARLDEMGIRDMTERVTGNSETDYVDPETGEVEGVELLPPSIAAGLLIPGINIPTPNGDTVEAARVRASEPTLADDATPEERLEALREQARRETQARYTPKTTTFARIKARVLEFLRG